MLKLQQKFFGKLSVTKYSRQHRTDTVQMNKKASIYNCYI